jgi:hypothetical protein
MANGSSRFLTVLISLIIGFGAGWLLHTAPVLPPPPPPPPLLTPSPSPTTVTPVPSPPPPADWDVAIGDNPCDLTDPNGQKSDLQVVQKGKNKIKWHSKHGQHIYLVLHVPPCSNPNSDPPFANAFNVGSANGKSLWAIGDGSKSNIDSGKVNANQCPSDPSNQSTWIKYDQFIQTPQGPFLYCDGWIIIK